MRLARTPCSAGEFSHDLSIHRSGTEAAVQEAARVGQARGGACHRRAGHAVCGAGGRGLDRPCRPTERRDHAGNARKQIFAVPTFTIFEYFADHADTPAHAARERAMLDLHEQEFRTQIAAGVPMAVGSDVGPFPHGTQAREFELMVKYGMSPLAVAAGGSAEWREAAGLGWPDWLVEAGLSSRCHRRSWRSVAGHQCGAEGIVRDEGRSDLQEVRSRTRFL